MVDKTAGSQSEGVTPSEPATSAEQASGPYESGTGHAAISAQPSNTYTGNSEGFPNKFQKKPENKVAQALRRKRHKENAQKAEARKQDELRALQAQVSQLRREKHSLQATLEEQHSQSKDMMAKAALLVSRHKALATANKALQMQLAKALELHPDLHHHIQPLTGPHIDDLSAPSFSEPPPIAPLPSKPHAAGPPPAQPDPDCGPSPMAVDASACGPPHEPPRGVPMRVLIAPGPHPMGRVIPPPHDPRKRPRPSSPHSSHMSRPMMDAPPPPVTYHPAPHRPHAATYPTYMPAPNRSPIHPAMRPLPPSALHLLSYARPAASPHNDLTAPHPDRRPRSPHNPHSDDRAPSPHRGPPPGHRLVLNLSQADRLPRAFDPPPSSAQTPSPPSQPPSRPQPQRPCSTSAHRSSRPLATTPSPPSPPSSTRSDTPDTPRSPQHTPRHRSTSPHASSSPPSPATVSNHPTPRSHADGPSELIALPSEFHPSHPGVRPPGAPLYDLQCLPSVSTLIELPSMDSSYGLIPSLPSLQFITGTLPPNSQLVSWAPHPPGNPQQPDRPLYYHVHYA